MSLLEMSLSGGVLIGAVMLLRLAALNRLPKGTFLVLWWVAAARLLLPVSIPSPVSVYSLAGETPETVVTAVFSPRPTVAPGESAAGPPAGDDSPALPSGAGEGAFPLREAVWLTGALLWGALFAWSYLRSRRAYRAAVPVEEGPAADWLARRGIRRRVVLRRSDRIDAPLTYGVLRPVILLPGDLDRSGGDRLEWVLEHELVHIQHLDCLLKLVLVLAVCVHWFNPLVWGMLVLANRDMELRCDETVVARLGYGRRGAYARALIDLEERRGGLGPFASAFNKNAIEERIRAIMRMKKRSLAAILAAIVLVCGVSAAFATSAMERAGRPPVPSVPEGSFTDEELERLSGLWLEGWEDMTVADYRERMGPRCDGAEALMDRYGQNRVTIGYFNDPEATEQANAFETYFLNVCAPLTGENWEKRFFHGAVGAGEDHKTVVEYSYSLEILDPEALTAGAYGQAHRDVREGAREVARQYAAGELEEWAEQVGAFWRLSQQLSTGGLSVTVEGNLMVRSFGPKNEEDPDTELHRQFSREAAAGWDELLAPYEAFGLTHTFYDPDLDGNGLTMWFEGREVRGIFDEQKGLWITEHTGDSAYGEGAVELYAVYTGGILSGLRLATPEEQAAWDESRVGARIYLGTATVRVEDGEEQREFPQASRADYDGLLALRTEGYERMSLEAFNGKLLEWANDHGEAWDRINCDVTWNDYGAELTEEERSFAALTCRLSGTENGQMIRALHTGGPEEDPGFAASLSEKWREESGVVTGWCDLYYDVSYHILDKSAATVGERDRCAAGMLEAIESFWRDTDLETLLGMTEAEVADRFTAWGAENSGEHVRFHPVTVDNLHFEAADERPAG